MANEKEPRILDLIPVELRAQLKEEIRQEEEKEKNNAQVSPEMKAYLEQRKKQNNG